MSNVKLTIAGASRVKKVLKYDSLSINQSTALVTFYNGKYAVGELVMPPSKARDTVIISGLKGKLIIEGD